ncbi:MAG: SDR family oxidoreductase [Bacteroidales bacterium]|jgi:NAD(P)-dependent dehydrogenase (short-subunit alcohol dehydrogenase family)|nr:SDR family oxidoreductase [Bacteroidales bacterium]
MKNVSSEPVAVITGGASGIGFAIAQKFVANKTRVELLGRDQTRLKLACEALGDLANYSPCDLNDLSSLPGIVNAIAHRYGHIDILVNNAGVHLRKSVHEVSDSDFESVVRTNQTAMFVLTREVTALMKQRRKGAVLNISSMASRYGLPNVIAYTASKSAIEGMTRALAVELAGHGIRVNCIAPGFIRTNMSAMALESDPERKKEILSRTPMGRLGKPSEVADAAYFLCTPDSSFITGVVLPVDGGLR